MRLKTLLTCTAIAVALVAAGKLLGDTGLLSGWRFDWHRLASLTPPSGDARKALPRPQDYNGMSEEEVARLILSQLPPVDVPLTEVCFAMAYAAEDTGLPVPFFARLIWQESGFRQRVVSHAGAQGVAQFMPKTAEFVGLADPFDPTTALPASARYLRAQIQTFGNLGLAAAAYNAGARRVTDWLSRKGKLPEETRNYVKVITGHEPEKWLEENQALDLAHHLPQRAPCEGVAGLSRTALADPVTVRLEPPIARMVAEAREAEARALAKLAKAKRAQARFAARKHSTYKIMTAAGGTKKAVRVADAAGRPAGNGRLAKND